MSKSALIVVDMQNDFITGSLAVPQAETIIPVVNSLLRSDKFDLKVATKDWHPKNHCSFKENGGIWPSHCVMGEEGAELTVNLEYEYLHLILHKGYRTNLDSYSGFYENDDTTQTGLDGYLFDNDIKRVYICGLALDYCVTATARHAAMLSLEPHIIMDACAAIDIAKWTAPLDVTLIESKSLAAIKAL